MRKPPQMPRWYWLDTDGCWFCKNRNACSNCSIVKRYRKKYFTKKEKGKTLNSEVLERINDGSATIDDYVEFFATFGVTLYKADGTFKTVGEIFKEASERKRGS